MSLALLAGSLPALQPHDGEEEGLMAGEDWGEPDEALGAHGSLCSSLAAAIVLREPLSADAAAAVQRLALFNLTLALPSDDAGNGPDCLLRLPVVEGGRLRSGPLEPAPDATLPPGTAAWEAWSSGRRLLWTRSGGEPPPYPDWRSLLAGSEGGESVPAPAALLTVPIAAASIPAALGAATLALEWAPSAEELEELEGLCQCLARCISHHTKALWEESLGFLHQVFPRRVVQRMLSAALKLGPLAAAAGPPPPQAAAPVAAAAGRWEEVVASPPGTPACNGGGGEGRVARTSLLASGSRVPVRMLSPETPCSAEPSPAASLDAGTALPGEASAALPTEAGAALPDAPTSCKAAAAAAAAEEEEEQERQEQLGSPRAPPPVTLDTRQKWNLEFADPGLEESYRTWFNTMQTATDLAVFRYYSVLLLSLVVALIWRGGLSLSDWLAMGHGVLSLAVLAFFMLLNTPWYINNRSFVVACVRISSAALLLLHAYLDPEFYTGSLLKGLAGSCALTLVANSFRNRLRFSNHLLVQLAKLYLCALTNAFIYSDASRAGRAHMALPTTTLVQLAAALIPSAAVYRLESRARRDFLRSRLAAALWQAAAVPADGVLPAGKPWALT